MLQETADTTKAVVAVVGVLISGPVIIAMVRAIIVVGRLENMLDTTSKNLEQHTRQVTRSLEQHEIRLRDAEGKVLVLWDGRERRAGYTPTAEGHHEHKGE